MKNLSLTTLLIIITLGFSSCSQDDSTLIEEPMAEDMLKSFNLSRSADGDYSLDYELGSGVSADNVLDNQTNTKNIYLYSSEEQIQKRHYEGLQLQKGEFKVKFNNTIDEQVQTITVFDDDIKFSKNSNELLSSYDITNNGDGTYDLDFTVRDGVSVDIIYNGDSGIYEVHMINNDSESTANHSEVFNKSDDEPLTIAFMDYSNRQSRDSVPPPKKPIIIFD
jgi:hypothetical protein